MLVIVTESCSFKVKPATNLHLFVIVIRPNSLTTKSVVWYQPLVSPINSFSRIFINYACIFVFFFQQLLMSSSSKFISRNGWKWTVFNIVTAARMYKVVSVRHMWSHSSTGFRGKCEINIISAPILCCLPLKFRLLLSCIVHLILLSIEFSRSKLKGI